MSAEDASEKYVLIARQVADLKAGERYYFGRPLECKSDGQAVDPTSNRTAPYSLNPSATVYVVEE